MRSFKLTLTWILLPFILELVQGKNTRDIGTPWLLSGVPLAGDELIAPPREPVQCNPNECKETGNCNSFRICSEGSWKNQTCGEDLY
ncbi:unnamed protein product [Allacma fusca]|uniref:Uncharacterized protein n=1 Tax=Allacma fusca TaxID=39272 RepID=A0A8J2KZ94_9HEXA|nr:unnamed protein product [Allacma fusca]